MKFFEIIYIGEPQDWGIGSRCGSSIYYDNENKNLILFGGKSASVSLSYGNISIFILFRSKNRIY